MSEKNNNFEEYGNAFEDIKGIKNIIANQTLAFSQFFLHLQENEKRTEPKDGNESETELEETEDIDQYYIDLLQEKELQIEKITMFLNQQMESNRQLSKQILDIQTQYNLLLEEHRQCSEVRKQLLDDKLEIISQNNMNEQIAANFKTELEETKRKLEISNNTLLTLQHQSHNSLMVENPLPNSNIPERSQTSYQPQPQTPTSSLFPSIPINVNQVVEELVGKNQHVNTRSDLMSSITPTIPSLNTPKQSSSLASQNNAININNDEVRNEIKKDEHPNITTNNNVNNNNLNKRNISNVKNNNNNNTEIRSQKIGGNEISNKIEKVNILPSNIGNTSLLPLSPLSPESSSSLSSSIDTSPAAIRQMLREYKANNEDEIDMIIAENIRGISLKGGLEFLPPNFARISPGLYIFGTKKIHIHIHLSQPYVRVGGGYMEFPKFVRKYGRVECQKVSYPTVLS